MSFSAGWMGQVVELTSTGGKKRARVQLLRNGDFYHPQAPGKRLKIDDARLAEFEKNFRDGIRGKELPTNRDHDDPQFKNSPSWIVDMIRTPGELHGIVEFTDPVLADKVERGEVKYFSPEIMFGWNNPEDKKTYNCIKGAAWTNVPYIKNMQPATILNLSEMAANDANLVTLSCVKDLDKQLGAMVAEAAPLESEFLDGEVKNIVERCARLSETPQDFMVGAVAAVGRQIDALNTLIDTQPNGRDKRTPFVPVIDEIMKSIVRQHKVSLAEVRLAMQMPEDPTMGGMPGDGSDMPDEGMDGQSDNQNQPDEFQDADAQDPNLPDQCRLCQLLSDGSCPFQGVQIKMAAAGDGNCPQYISSTAQTSNIDKADNPNQQQGMPASTARMSEPENQGTTNMPNPPTSEAAAPETPATSATAVVTPEQLAAVQTQLSEVAAENARLAIKLAESEARRLTELRDIRINGWLDSGRITSHQATLLGEMLAMDNGATVKLGEGDAATDVTLSDLINQFIESVPEATTPLSERVTSGAVRDLPNRPGSTATLAESQWDEWQKRAKDIALAEGTADYQQFLGRAAKEVAAEKAANVNGRVA